MRTLLSTSAFVFLSGIAPGQSVSSNSSVPTLPIIGNKIVYSEQVHLDSSWAKERLFYNAQQWYGHNFQSADNVLTIDNSNDCKISGPAIVHYAWHKKHKDERDLFFTIDIISGRGIYEYRLYDIHGFNDAGKFFYSDMYNEQLYPPKKPRWPEKYRKKMLLQMNSRVAAVIGGIRKDMIRVEWPK
jgi:hypothetical protein